MSEKLNLKNLIDERKLPDLIEESVLKEKYHGDFAAYWADRRIELHKILAEKEYGYLPPKCPCSVEVVSSEEECAGKALLEKCRMTVNGPKGTYSFDFDMITPVNVDKIPMFLLISFCKEIPNVNLPMEEIIDNGYGMVNMYYNAVTDDSPAQNGIYPIFERDENTGYGTLSLWAWAASRILDWLLTLSKIDGNRVAVIGHSRLGKTALWCMANDPRFSLAVSNDSGCSGAAIYRDKVGEVKGVIKRFTWWFCGNFYKDTDEHHDLSYDQHYLLALCAPKNIYVASALNDEWADPMSEYLSCEAAAPAYTALTGKGFVSPDRLPVPEEEMHDGIIGYHLRTGTHYLSRADWQRYFRYRNKHNL